MRITYRLSLLSCILVLCLLHPSVADITDSLMFFEKNRSQAQSIELTKGAYTVVHYFRRSCQCCEDISDKLSRSQSSAVRYLPVLADEEDLPRFEVYNPNRSLMLSGEEAFQWAQKELGE